MSEQKPKTENSLGEYVKDSIGNDLSINANVAGAIGNTPDARIS